MTLAEEEEEGRLWGLQEGKTEKLKGSLFYLKVECNSSGHTEIRNNTF